MPVRQSGQLIVVRHAVESTLVLDELLFGLSAQGHIVSDVCKDVAAVSVERIASHFDVDEGAVLASQLHVQRHLRICAA